ncbi:MAG: type II toxin-antitoxin system VapC family toxin [Allosphingosinicella sp.]
MKAVDTNVPLRLLTGDDPAQETVARTLLGDEGILISLTVLMETEWVLRSFYRWTRSRIADALEALAALDGVQFERRPAALWAIARFRAGADMADMIHLLVQGEHDGFATFDASVARAAGESPPLPVLTLR